MIEVTCFLCGGRATRRCGFCGRPVCGVCSLRGWMTESGAQVMASSCLECRRAGGGKISTRRSADGLNKPPKPQSRRNS